MIGAFPGSFNPPTIAHLAIAERAMAVAGLTRIDLILSRSALGKEHLGADSVPARAEILTRVAATRPWLGVVVTEHRLIADIAAGYDAVVLGADKWEQVHDPAWYGGSTVERDAALARLPRILVAPRTGAAPQRPAARGDRGFDVLDVPEALHSVSATAVRERRGEAERWILPEALASGLWS